MADMSATSESDRVELLRQSYNEETRLRWAAEEERDRLRNALRYLLDDVWAPGCESPAMREAREVLGD